MMRQHTLKMSLECDATSLIGSDVRARDAISPTRRWRSNHAYGRPRCGRGDSRGRRLRRWQVKLGAIFVNDPRDEHEEHDQQEHHIDKRCHVGLNRW